MSVQRINFTKRSRLTRDQANVAIHPDGDNRPATFEARLNLSKLREHAGEARVFVEAYHQTTRMRFDFGVVAALDTPPPSALRLTEFSDWQDVRFRVKVTDTTHTPGRLVAWADRIKPKGPDDADEPDLVHFKDADLYGRLWDLEFHEDRGPVVLIEKSQGAQDVGRNPAFQAAVYPEVLRRTLEHAFIHEQTPYPAAGHWSTTWVDGFLKPKLGLAAPPVTDGSEERAVRDWVQQAVERFARRHRFADLWADQRKENP
ncbi:MAG: hypothetical protein AAF288_00520 [Planctomycetota bacterium]